MRFGCSSRRFQLLAVTVSVITIITILVILFLSNYPTLVRQRIIDGVVFKNGSMEWTRFETTKDLTNLRLEFYVFSVTNVDDVIKKSAKIKLQEVGPFVYHEYKYKEILDNNQTSGLITFKLRTRYTFQRHLSVGDPKLIKITWPNVPLLSAKSILDKYNAIESTLAYMILNRNIKAINEPAFITDSIENFIFSGSKRELFVRLQKEDIFKIIRPWPLKDNKFALLYGKNDTWNAGTDRIYTVSAGFGANRNYTDLNRYIYANNSDKLPYWNANPPTCNKLDGTDGEFFSPFLEQDKTLQVYSIDLCRKMDFKYRKSTYINGINTWMYTLDERSLQSGFKNPQNKCYCLAKDPKGVIKRECILDGLIDLSTCVSPNVVASGAHFFAGSPELRTKLNGVTTPNASIHEPTLFIEPNTGLPIGVKVPLQFNIRLQKNQFDNFKFFNDPEPTIVPLVWISENAELTQDQASLLRSKLLLLDSWLVLAVLGGTIIFISAIIVIATIVCVRYRESRAAVSLEEQTSERSPLVREPSPENRLTASQRSRSDPRNYRTV